MNVHSSQFLHSMERVFLEMYQQQMELLYCEIHWESLCGTLLWVMGGGNSVSNTFKTQGKKKKENNKEERVTTGRSQSGRDPEN